MNELETKCAELLTELFEVQLTDVPNHPFYKHICALNRQAKNARLIYPFVYIALGLILWSIFSTFDPTINDQWQKLFGAVLGVFSALLAFWKPTVLLTQEDCRIHLNKKLTATDLREFNDLLGLPSKKVDDILKLVGAIASFVAIYFLTVV